MSGRGPRANAAAARGAAQGYRSIDRRSLLASFAALVLPACGKSGSGTGPSDAAASRGEALELLRSPVFREADGRTHRWPSTTIAYRVEGNEALRIAANGGAAFWNGVLAGLATFVESQGPASIVVRYGNPSPVGRCGRADHRSNGRGSITSAEITINPDGTCRIDSLLLAHELGHTISINHTDTGIMAAGALSLSEGPPALFEAVRLLYSSPAGTRFV